ncbi:MAG: hypothetical protein ABW194_00615 [Novosphingobium sp.]
MRLVLQIVGVALILSGGLWALQGAGLVMWPAQSFMLAQREWVIYGLVTVAVGAILLWLGRRPAR